MAAENSKCAIPALVFSLISLLIALVALVAALADWRDEPAASAPGRASDTISALPGQGLAAYDYSGPREAIMSNMKRRALGDVRAEVELNRALALAQRDTRLREYESLKFAPVVEYEGKSLVMYQYSKGGLLRYETDWMQRKGDFYVRANQNTYGWDKAGGDRAKIHAMIKAWKAQGTP